jgi:hypothetical protein
MRAWHKAFTEQDLAALEQLIRDSPGELNGSFVWNFWTVVTPLGCALMTKNLQATTMLLDAGVDPDCAHCFLYVTHRSYLSAMEMVLHFGFATVFAVKLIEYGAQWNGYLRKSIRDEMYRQRWSFIFGPETPVPTKDIPKKKRVRSRVNLP